MKGLPLTMPTQPTIPGLPEPPGRDPEIDQAIERKYEHIAAKKLALEAIAVTDAKLLELVKLRGQPYPFLEPGTGRKKTLRVNAAEKLKTVANKSPKKEQADKEWETAQAEARGGDQQDAAREEWEAEIKRRRGAKPIETVSVGFGEVSPPDDPFAATRSQIDDPSSDDDTPAQPASRRNKRAAR